MKAAVIGASGYIGSHIWQECLKLNAESTGTYFKKKKPGLTYLDIRNSSDFPLLLEDSGHELVIICSAIPNIAFCQKNLTESNDINVLGTIGLIEAVAKTKMKVVFLSSDYVFDGHTGSYTDSHPTFPSTNYGKQKAEVEKSIPDITNEFLIVRISKIFGTQRGDGTLLDEMTGNLLSSVPIRLANDQFFNPTEVNDLVRAILMLSNGNYKGTFNVASPLRISRHQIGIDLAKKLKVNPKLVKSISLNEIHEMKGRPLDTSLECKRLKIETDFKFTTWDQSLNKILHEFSIKV